MDDRGDGTGTGTGTSPSPSSCSAALQQSHMKLYDKMEKRQTNTTWLYPRMLQLRSTYRI